MTNRRTVLKILGGGFVVAAGATAFWATTRDPAAARQPWADAGQSTDPRLHALSFAILAPNPHNRQPWIADVSAADTITLFCEGDRRLPQTDPFDRQITIGLGSFLELLAMAAAETGHRTEITLFPEGEPQPRLDGRPVARVLFVKDATAAKDPLFAQVLKRHTNRLAFDITRPVDPALLADVMKAARNVRVEATTDASRVITLREAAWDAMYTEMSTHGPALESIDLTRIGKAEIEANPDGISLAGPFLEGLSLAGLLPREAMLDTTSSTFKQMVDSLKLPFDTAMAFVWTTTSGNTRADQIAAGRDHVRIHLAATKSGLALQPFSQALQEFAEMRPHFDRIRTDLAIAPSETLQMFVRLGYAGTVPPAPRWPLSNRIRT